MLFRLSHHTLLLYYCNRHEVRNPLSAALSASVFVGTAVQGELTDDAVYSLREDANIINSSLRFIK